MNAPSPYAYGVRAVHDNIVYLGRVHPARRSDSELAKAIEAHCEQIAREQQERDDQFARERDLVCWCAAGLVALATLAMLMGGLPA